MDGGNQTKFSAPEFSEVFSRIADKDNKDGYYCIRRLDKFHSTQFEKRINSANVGIQNLRSLTTSKFADQISYLTVRVPGNLADLSELCQVSPTFLRNIHKVNVIISEGYSGYKSIYFSQPVVFRGLNVVRENGRGYIELRCQNHDVQIIDSNFDCVGIRFITANKATVRNSSFRNNTENFGLHCGETQNTITIDNVQFFNCRKGLGIALCGNINVSVNKIYSEKCRIGCQFFQVHGEIILNDSEIVDCETGMNFYMSDSFTVQNCNIIGAFKTGIKLQYSTVQYRRIFIDLSEGVEGEFKKIDSVSSTFTELL